MQHKSVKHYSKVWGEKDILKEATYANQGCIKNTVKQ